MLANNTPSSSSEPFATLDNGSNNSKRKRRPAGTPDPDAEVVSLSPKTLLESDRYVCEICNQGFQRDQNLQMHRRRHKVPWKLLKRETPVVRKRVFVCPEPTCLHHDPCHALGDLVGIKKHFRRKHSNQKQWVCGKCSKGYAVQSDYKAHLKTCGTRGHSCDCGRVFSRVESFIEHQDACSMGRLRSESQSHHLQPAGACLSRTASSPSPSSDTNLSAAAAPWPLLMSKPATFMDATPKPHNLELQLLTTTSASSSRFDVSVTSKTDEDQSTQLQLSIGSSSDFDAREQLRLAMAEKAYAEEARQQAKRQIELAEQELANAKRIRQQAQEDLDKAQAMREHAIKQINSTLAQITCHACKNKFEAPRADHYNTSSMEFSYISSSSMALTEGHGQK
ncbi:zinc finger protein SHOOT GRAVITROPISM 5-like isoform X2 [Ipomoea triloba]|uniref:zinc finger protein SHOOT GRAVITROPISM 5-like isoform X1 n=1 Tax=Ipomoea triloba TaxID=35885 RepID=UPI00125E4B77|nr:zinc finger protein SHOOT GRAVITROPISM 5-like isoform X1 [Ipomoea triloba]XP_031105812.1 zinc finger protein SHOOT GRAVITROPISM 5-like isoform X2 [Ipomoea triloba]